LSNNAELTAAAQEVAKNNEALRVNTEALIKNANTGNEAYDKSSFKEFIDATNIDDETKEEESRLKGLKDKEFWQEYENYLNATGDGTKYRVVDRNGKATVEK
jgi:hypothetical protein